MFCKKGVLRNLAKIHRNTPVPESLFNKVAGPAELLRWLLLIVVESMHDNINSIKFLESTFTESNSAYSFQRSSRLVLGRSFLKVPVYQMLARPDC